MSTNIPQWAQNLPPAVQAKIPEGATGCTKDGDVYIFTKDGTAMSGGKYNADGSVWTASASATSSNTPTVSQEQITQQIMQQGGSVFGSGFTGGTGGTDLSTSWMGGNYNINTNKMMGAAGLLGLTSMVASEVPFGLGGILGSLAIPGIMSRFMKSVAFNFNFGNMFTSNPTGSQSGTTSLPEGFEQTNLSGVYKKDGKYYKQDANQNWLECDDTGKVKDEAKLPEGYEKTATAGIYKKGEEYMKYDAETRTYVACDKDGNKLPDKATPLVVPDGYKLHNEKAGILEKGGKYYKYDANKNLVECKADGSALDAQDEQVRTKPERRVNSDGYGISRHSDKVFYKSDGGTLKYYVKRGNNYVQVSDYDGKTYKINGRMYNAKTGVHIETEYDRQLRERLQASYEEDVQRTTFAADNTRVVKPIIPERIELQKRD